MVDYSQIGKLADAVEKLSSRMDALEKPNASSKKQMATQALWKARENGERGVALMAQRVLRAIENGGEGSEDDLRDLDRYRSEGS